MIKYLKEHPEELHYGAATSNYGGRVLENLSSRKNGRNISTKDYR